MNFIKASREVFSDYGIEITTERQLSDGEFIKHFETSNNIWVVTHLDPRVTMWTYEAMASYIEWTEPSEA